MPISPIDIQQQRFKSRPFGYDKTAVDQFLAMLTEEFERLIRQNHDLQEQLARHRASLNEMRKRETTLKEALLTTQKVTDDLKAGAKREAEAMMAHAELRAERLLRKAEDRRLELIGELQEIKRQKIDFETSLRALLERHVRMLDIDISLLEKSPSPPPRIAEPPRPAAEAKRPAAPPDKAARVGTQSAPPRREVPTSSSGSGATEPDLDFDLDFEPNDTGVDGEGRPK